MKKISSFRLFAFCLFLAQISFGQSTPAFQKGNSMLQLGVGLGANYFTGSVKTPPLQFKYEKAINDEVSVGGIAGYASSQDTYGSNYVDYSYLLIGARANYHFGTTDRFDPYAGGTLGYNKIGYTSSPGFIGSYASSLVLYGAQVGANYYFTPKIGAWAELGYGIGYLNLGLTVKL